MAVSRYVFLFSLAHALLLLLPLQHHASAASLYEATETSLELLWTLNDTELNQTLLNAHQQVDQLLQQTENATAADADFSLQQTAQSIQHLARLALTMTFQVNAANASNSSSNNSSISSSMRDPMLLNILQMTLQSLGFNSSRSSSERSLLSCRSEFFSRIDAADTAAELSLQRLWRATQQNSTRVDQLDFVYTTSTYHPNLGSGLYRFLSGSQAAESARKFCCDGDAHELVRTLHGSLRLLVRAAAVDLSVQQRQGSLQDVHSLRSFKTTWNDRLKQVANKFSQQLQTLMTSGFSDSLRQDALRLVNVFEEFPTGKLVSLLTEKYRYLRYAVLAAPKLNEALADLGVWPDSSEFVCFNETSKTRWLLLLCRNRNSSTVEEAAAAAEWKRLRNASGQSGNSIPATPLEAARAFRPDEASSAAVLLKQMTTPELMTTRLAAAGNTSFLAFKLAEFGAAQSVFVSASDESFVVHRQDGQIFYAMSPVQLTVEFVEPDEVVPSPTSATSLTVSALTVAVAMMTTVITNV